MRLFAALILLSLSLCLGGCFSFGSGSGTDPVSSGVGYYYDEFVDVAIPKEMTAKRGDTFITYTTDGVKLGSQLVSGRVEMTSLVSAMYGHMLRDGWRALSVFRFSSRSLLIFEKAERICTFHISEGLIDTEMLFFISQKLQPGSVQSLSPTGAFVSGGVSAPTTLSTEPLSPSDPPMSSSGEKVTVYPAQ